MTSIRILLGFTFLAQFLFGQLSPDQLARIEKLESQLLAPCCWVEPIGQHRSDVALKMREEVREMVAAGQTDREILDHYKQEYGPRVLVEPEGNLWWWMNVVPVLVLGIGLLVAIYVLRRWKSSEPAESPLDA